MNWTPARISHRDAYINTLNNAVDNYSNKYDGLHICIL